METDCLKSLNNIIVNQSVASHLSSRDMTLIDTGREASNMADTATVSIVRGLVKPEVPALTWLTSYSLATAPARRLLRRFL